MLGLIGNLSIGETLMIAVLAILIFGRRLPEVAAQVVGQIRKVRRSLDDMRRETGIDREFHNMRREFDQAAREAQRPALPDVVERTPGTATAVAVESVPSEAEDNQETDVENSKRSGETAVESGPESIETDKGER